MDFYKTETTKRYMLRCSIAGNVIDYGAASDLTEAGCTCP
jgi:hypothetical protein